MALSKTVEESLTEAVSHLRNALAFAARQERAGTCHQIAKVISEIESIKSIDSIMDMIECKDEPGPLKENF